LIKQLLTQEAAPTPISFNVKLRAVALKNNIIIVSHPNGKHYINIKKRKLYASFTLSEESIREYFSFSVSELDSQMKSISQDLTDRVLLNDLYFFKTN